MKRLSLLALLCAAASASSCNFPEETSDISVQVVSIPPEADHVDVTLIDAGGKETAYRPSFQPGALPGGLVQLALKAPAAVGPFTVKAVAGFKSDALAQGQSQGSLGGAINLVIVLHTSGSIGSFSTPCALPGPGSTSCVSGLECKIYAAGTSEAGVCTHTCASAGDCSATVPAATCPAFPGGTALFCQWDCTSGEACPSGLTCRAASSGGHRFCTGA